MSFTVSLLVRFPEGIKGDDAVSEEWGTIQVVAVPRVGETLDVEHDGDLEVVVVRAVHNFAVPEPIPASLNPNTQRKAPSIKIYGEWSPESQW